jgi:colanic acid biosynthesis glycosyl transferase WcaI
MKILLVSLNYAPEQTGIGKFQGEMGGWLAARGHRVRVVAAPPYYPEWKIGKGYKGYLYKPEDINGVRVYRVPLYVPSVQSGFKRLAHLASFAFTSFPVILGQAAIWRPDVVMLTAPPLMAAPAVFFAGLVSGARTHLHVQDFEVDAAFNMGLLKKAWLFRLASGVERIFLRAFSTVSSISPRMVDRLRTKGVAEDRTFLVQNWAGIDDFDPSRGSGTWRERLKLDKEKILVLYSGNLGRKQGLEVIIEAARRLRSDPRIRFVISGDGTGRADMEAAAKGVDNIVFLPVQPLRDFISLMIAADIHLLPQKTEAADLVMPSKLGNMLASGRPIVAGATPNTQVFEAIQGCGIAVTPNSPEDFAQAIMTLAQDENLRRKMGEAGCCRAREEWSKDKLLFKLERMLEKSSGHARRQLFGKVQINSKFSPRL